MFRNLKKNISKLIWQKPLLCRAARILYHSSESCKLVYTCRNWTANKYIRLMLKILVTPFCIFKFFHVRNVPGREGLAFVLIAKNEAPYIKEWLDFHIKQGVNHFIIYDNESTDNFHEILAPYIASGVVTYHTINGIMRQRDAYNMAVNDYAYRFKYMGFIDADEFVFVRNNTYGGGGHDLYPFIDGFMNAHPNAGGIAIHWLIFGSNGHVSKPEGGVLENYTMCAEKDYINNHLTKTITDPMKILGASGHLGVYRIGFYNIDENGNILDKGIWQNEVCFEQIRINHYYAKSIEEFKAKIEKGKADRLGTRSMGDFAFHDKNDIRDTEILSYI